MVENIEVQAEFKETEVGLIPSDWEVNKISSISETCTGSTPPTKDPANYGSEYLFVSPSDLGKGRLILNAEKKLSLKGYNLSRKYPKNSILFTCIGSTIGKSGIASFELTSNQQINAIFPNSTFNSDYLYYVLSLFTNKIRLGAGETAVPIINKTEFGEIQIPLPPTLAEQTAIATALNDADALITQLEKLIAKKRAIKQGAMQELLKPKEGWEVKTINSFAEICTGNTPPTDDPSNYGDEYLFVSPSDLGKGRLIRNTEKKLSQKGFNISRKYPARSVLFTCIGSTIGKSGISVTDLTSNQQINAVLPNHTFDSDYLFYTLLLLTDKIKSGAGETAVPIINKTEFGETPIPFPPSLTLQVSIAKTLNDMDTEIEVLEKKLAKYQLLKQGMMQNLLTGRIRLI